MSQPDGDHENRASRKFPDPGNSSEGLGTEVCNRGMIRHVNADRKPVTAWYVDPNENARSPVEDEEGSGGPPSP